MHPRFDEILTPEALAFVAKLDGAHAGRRAELLAARRERARRIAAGDNLDFLAEHRRHPQRPGWRVAPPAPGLEDRRCEITGPPSRKMSINALNSGARVWMADFEDATSPSWFNIIDGQLNLYDAIRGQLDFTAEDGKEYKVGEPAPRRSWCGPAAGGSARSTCSIDGRPLPAALVDFGLFFFHNAQTLIDSGAGPVLLPAEAGVAPRGAAVERRVRAGRRRCSGIPQGTIRATVLIETLPAAFEMEEILYELRDHSVGAERRALGLHLQLHQDLRASAAHEYVLPDRSQITMTTPFMRAYTELLVTTCHARGAHAIGGMAAFVPNKADPDSHRAGARQGQGRQAARGGRRIRRFLGRASGPRPDLHRGVRRGARRPAEPARQAAPRRARSRRAICWRRGSTPGSVTLAGAADEHLGSRCGTSRRGSAARAPWPSTT